MIVIYQTPSNPSGRFESKSDSIIIGRIKSRGKKVDLDLSPDPTISNAHARLTCKDGVYWIEDLGSTNGICVDGLVISEKTRLAPEAKIQIGRAVLQIEPGGDSPISELLTETDSGRADDVSPILQTHPTGLESAVEGPAQELRKLKAFYSLSQALGRVGTLDSLEEVLVQQLQRAIPSAQRGAVLLPGDQGELLLKTHWPLGSHSVSMTMAKDAFAEGKPITWDAPEEHSALSGTPTSVIFYETKSALYVPLMSGGQALGVMYVDNSDQCDAFSSADLDFLTTIAGQVARFIRDHLLEPDLKREEIIRANLLRQFSPAVAAHILEDASRLQLGGNRVDPLTILVSDVRGFTSLSAKMEPANVVRMLNEMFDAFVPIIFEYDGVIDKYVGDSVLAVFGSPKADTQQWEKAVRAALDMQQAIGKLGEAWKLRRLPVFEVGIGIHSGEAIQGFIGSSQRTEYTVIGNTVNRAARYCDGAARGEILISNAVYERVYRVVKVEAKTIKTKHPETEPDLKAYQVKGLKEKA